MKKRERLVWREGFVVTTIPGSGREEHLSLDGGETTAYFLTELAARVAARRHVPAGVPWYPDFVGGFYRRDRQPKIENMAAPWWQNDGPTWFTRCDYTVDQTWSGAPAVLGPLSAADQIHLKRVHEDAFP